MAARAARPLSAPRGRSPPSRRRSRPRRRARPAARRPFPRSRSDRRDGASPPRASSSSRSTVSVASFLFVPITPLGPRLIQPAQYSRPPPTLGRPRSGSGRPRTGLPAARPPGSRRSGRRSRTGSSRARRSAPREIRPASSATSAVAHDLDRLDAVLAEDRNRRDAEAQTDRASARPAGARAAYSRSTSTFRRAFVSVSSAASLAGSSSRSAGSTITSASASSPSSFSSGVVNAAWAGPRRASSTISFKPGAEDRVDRRVGRVGRPISSGASASIRTTSIATLPFPTTTARSPERSNDELLEVGVAVVPGDELGGGPRARQVLAGDAHAPVGLRADRVDDRVVEAGEIRRA